jgi:glutamate/aspartate transport system substrate-binding protein
MARRPAGLLVAACLLLGAATAGAQAARSATLAKIASHGAIYVGFSETAAPFSYLDGDGRVIGFSTDLCARVVDAVQRRLGRAAIEVVPIPVTEGNRRTLLESGTIDLECGATVNTQQRQRYASFSVTTFAAGVKALTRKDAGISSFADLSGRTVVTATGASTEAHVRAAAMRRGLKLDYRVGRNDADSLRQVASGQADVAVFDDVARQRLLMDLTPEAASQLAVLAGDIAVEPHGLVFRRNDPEFKQLVDDTLRGLMQSGEFARLYDQWFTAPIPPDGKVFNLPMSGVLKQLIITPNDKGI